MAGGILMALGVGLARLPVLLIAIAPIGLLTVELLRRKVGYVVHDRKRVIALNALLPGAFAPTMAGVVLMMAAVFIVLNVPAEAVPTWAIVAMGAVVGGALAPLRRRSELHRMTAIRGLERANESDGG